MKKIIISGNLARDPETGASNSGAEYTRFVMAVNAGRDKDPLWFRVTAFGTLAKNAAAYLAKGRHITVEGDFNFSTYARKDGGQGYSLDVTASDIDYGPRQEAPRQEAEQRPAEHTVDAFTDVTDDDIPF